MGRTEGLMDWGRWWLQWRRTPVASGRGDSWTSLLRARQSREAKAAAVAVSALRAQLGRSDAKVELLDFGAGHPQGGDAVSTTIGRIARQAGTDKRKARWLRAVALSTQGDRTRDRLRILEVGTSLGLGGVSLLHGSQGELDYTGMEGSPAMVAWASQHLGPWSPRLVTGPFDRTLPEEVARSQPYDVVFLDGHHEGEVLLDQWTMLQPLMTAGSCVVVDDIRWSVDMHQAWCALAGGPGVRSLDLFRMGVLIMDHGPKAPLLRVPTALLA